MFFDVLTATLKYTNMKNMIASGCNFLGALTSLCFGFVYLGLTTLYATLIVSINTPGNPPVYLPIAMIGLLMAGYIFNRQFLHRNNGT